MRIFELGCGQVRRVVGLPRDAARSRYFESLGLVRGAPAEVIFAARYGCVLRVLGVRLAMSRSAATEVEVEDLDETDSVRQPQFGKKHAV